MRMSRVCGCRVVVASDLHNMLTYSIFIYLLSVLVIKLIILQYIQENAKYKVHNN